MLLLPILSGARVLKNHPKVPIFIDDRLIERCYGLFQGRNKRKLEAEDPDFYTQCHRGYYLAPPEGESLEMVEKRVSPFFKQLKEWLEQNPGNVAISCHNNSIRLFRQVFENLSLTQTCALESPQDKALIYEFDLGNCKVTIKKSLKTKWGGLILPEYVKLATDPQNILKRYY